MVFGGGGGTDFKTNTAQNWTELAKVTKQENSFDGTTSYF
jgi:hypothetical protein